MKRLRRPQAIPVAGAERLSKTARRTRIVRLALAAALVAAVATEVTLGRNPAHRADALFPGGKSGIVVLDLSASVGAPGRRFTDPLRYLARTGQEFGLVIFSDTAYEALPPGTSSTELRPYIRRFTAPLLPCIVPPGYPCPEGTKRMSPAEARRARFRRSGLTPWSESFRGGTRISTGLRQAREVLEREHIEGRGVLLVSDLDDSLFDVPALTRELITYKERGIPVHLVALGPFRDDRLYFRRLLGEQAFVDRADLAPPRAEHDRARAAGAFPTDLVGLGIVALLLLGFNEHFCGRLTWRLRPSQGEVS